MDVLFSNRYTRDKAVAREFYTYYSFRRPVFYILLILMTILFLIGLAALLFTDSLLWLYMLLLPLWLIWHIVSHFVSIKTLLKRDKEQYGGPVTVESLVTDKHIQLIQTAGGTHNGSSQVEFRSFKKAIQTKNLILLRSKTRLVYIFRKDAFTLGTPEAFLEFLRTKGIKVR